MEFGQAVKASLSLTRLFIHAVRAGKIHFSVKRLDGGQAAVAVRDGLFMHATIKSVIEQDIGRELGRVPARSEVVYLRPSGFFRGYER